MNWYQVSLNYKNDAWLNQWAISPAKSKDDINMRIWRQIRQKHLFKLIDRNNMDNYPTEFLNSWDLPGLPPHNLQLNIGL